MNQFQDSLNVRQGFTIVPNWIFSLAFSAYEKLFLIALLSYARQKDGCYPGRERLAKDTSLSKRTLVGVVKDLTSKGLKMNRRGDGRTNYYASPRYANFSIEPPAEPPAEAQAESSVFDIEAVFTGLADEMEVNGLSGSNPMAEFETAEFEAEGGVFDVEAIFTGLANEMEANGLSGSNLMAEFEMAEFEAEGSVFDIEAVFTCLADEMEADGLSGSNPEAIFTDLIADLKIADQPILPSIQGEKSADQGERSADLEASEEQKCKPCTSESGRSANCAPPWEEQKHENVIIEGDNTPATPAPMTPNKGVSRSKNGYKSEFGEAECLEYANSLVGKGVKYPEAYAISIRRSGEQDKKIAAFQANKAAAAVIAEQIKSSQSAKLSSEADEHRKLEELEKLGEQEYDKLSEAEQDQLFGETADQLLSSSKAALYKRMPDDRFVEHVLYQVKKALALRVVGVGKFGGRAA